MGEGGYDYEGDSFLCEQKVRARVSIFQLPMREGQKVCVRVKYYNILVCVRVPVL